MGVRGVRDAGQKRPSRSHAGHDDGKWVFTGDTSTVSGQIRRFPIFSDHGDSYRETSLKVIPRGAPLPETKPFLDKSVRERWNDYGIGLLLQGDLKERKQPS